MKASNCLQQLIAKPSSFTLSTFKRNENPVTVIHETSGKWVYRKWQLKCVKCIHTFIKINVFITGDTWDLLEVTGMSDFSHRARNSCNDSSSRDCMSTSKSRIWMWSLAGSPKQDRNEQKVYKISTIYCILKAKNGHFKSLR